MKTTQWIEPEKIETHKGAIQKETIVSSLMIDGKCYACLFLVEPTFNDKQAYYQIDIYKVKYCRGIIEKDIKNIPSMKLLAEQRIVEAIDEEISTYVTKIEELNNIKSAIV